MNATLRTLNKSILSLLAGIVLTGTAAAEPVVDEPRTHGIRSELWLAVTSWPKLGDLQPVAGGSFDSLGYGLGGSVHWPVKSMPNVNLMIGIEGAVMATESDVPVLFDDLLARDGYLAASVKWQLGEAQNLSLDAGLAYHLLDITQLESDYNSRGEFESWEETAFGPYIGMTWDPGASNPRRESGLTFGLRAHFVDFGTVRDEDVLTSVVLGRDAGDLSGPVFVLRMGYHWR